MKPTLMLLPGLNCDAQVWEPQIQSLKDVAQCQVPAWGLKDSLTAMARQVLDEAPTQVFSVAGHSMGGRVALEVMRLAPQRVQRLALLSTGTHPLAAGEAGEKEKAGRMALLALARSQGMRAMASQWAQGMVHPARVGGPVFEQVLDMFERGSAEQFAAQIHALLHRPDAGGQLAAIACPTLVLTGRQDAWSGPAQHQTMAAAMVGEGAGAECVIVEDSGHMCTMEQPNGVAQALRRWMQR
jgi:pimeloyl-ACP methyl ester carboxylesterase